MSIYKKEKNLAIFKGAGLFSRHFFTAFAIVGSFVLFAMKFVGIPQYITFLIPILSIIAYCYVCTKFPLLLMSDDRIGDNAYYLGFIYTLTSLIFALWAFSSDLNATTDIIRSFGIALTSTMVGVMARVYYLSLSIDPDDVEKDARLKITAAANALTVELQQASTSFNIYRRSLQQSMEEAFVKVNETVDANLTKSADKITADLEKIGDDISETYGELNNSSSTLVEAIKNSVQSINKVNTKAEKSFTVLSDSATSLDAVIKGQAENLNQITTAAENFLKTSQSIFQQITYANEQVTRLGQSGQNINNITDKANTNLVTFSDALSAIAKAQKDVVDSISQNAEELKKQLNKTIKYTDEAHSSMSDMARTLADRLQ